MTRKRTERLGDCSVRGKGYRGEREDLRKKKEVGKRKKEEERRKK